ncbi:MAG: hypothetical protein HYZ51_02015 [Candidatus Doudnabacteria bacterium]|nr:hypothetical protein [Candidatus Doudnabacteria bacterium]
MNNSAKSKIYFAVFVWAALSFVMFGLIFKKLNASNFESLERIRALKKEQAILEVEKASFLQGKNDLEQLSSESIQPGDFFSKDITLVNEIRRLENIARDLNIQMNLSGISGTLKSAKRAGTKAEIYQIPFTISAQGPLASIVSFMEYLENLEFLTSVNAVSISLAGEGKVSAMFSASFYLKK